MISSKISNTSGGLFSINLFALLIFGANPLTITSLRTKGLNISRAISFGNPHSDNLRLGPTTMTDRPE